MRDEENDRLAFGKREPADCEPAKPEPVAILDGDTITWDGRDYKVRLYPANGYWRRKGTGVLVEVRLCDNDDVYSRKITDDDPELIDEAVQDCIGEIEEIMHRTREAEKQLAADEQHREWYW